MSPFFFQLYSFGNHYTLLPSNMYHLFFTYTSAFFLLTIHFFNWYLSENHCILFVYQKEKKPKKTQRNVSDLPKYHLKEKKLLQSEKMKKELQMDVDSKKQSKKKKEMKTTFYVTQNQADMNLLGWPHFHCLITESELSKFPIVKTL